MAQIEPAFQVNDLPFLSTSEAQAHKVPDGKVGQVLAKKLEAKGVISLAYMESGFRHMINNVRPVNRPEDVKGVKYRVMQNPVYIGMFSSLGRNAVPMAWGETYTAVQQGAIDGLELPIGPIDQIQRRAKRVRCNAELGAGGGLAGAGMIDHPSDACLCWRV